MAIEGYDLVMIGLLAAAAVLGYFKGIVWQLAWIAGIAASSWVAVRFGGPLAPFFGQQAPWNKLIAMLALYLATSLAVWLLFRVVAGFIDAIHLSAFDHQLGLLLGLAKGVLLCVVVTFFAITLAPGYRGQIVASRSGRLVAELIVRADQFLPREVIEAVDPFVRQFREQFAQPGATTVAAPDAAAPSPAAARSFFDTLTSAAAWVGAEPSGQGTRLTAGGPTSPPPTQATWAQPTPPALPPPPASQHGQQQAGSSGERFQPPPPGQAPAQPQPPARFPVGPQSPLPIR
jgi:membrane protein required for colicin V production